MREDRPRMGTRRGIENEGVVCRPQGYPPHARDRQSLSPSARSALNKRPRDGDVETNEGRGQMISNLPPDALYIRWGRFQAAIQGRLAIILATLPAMAVIAYRGFEPLSICHAHIFASWRCRSLVQYFANQISEKMS
jgi:hypothetical protein